MPAHRGSVYHSSAGFSLMELMIVMGILGTLFGLTTIDLTNLLPRVNASSAAEKISIDLKDQQLKAMIGDTEGRTTADQYGIYFQTNQYILFHGASYSAAQADNVSISIGSEFVIDRDLPNNSIVFQRRSGEVNNFDASNNSLTVTNTANNETKVLTINKLGVVTIN